MEFKTISLQMIQERELPMENCYVHEILVKGRVSNPSYNFVEEKTEHFNQSHRYTKLIFNSKSQRLQPVHRQETMQMQPPLPQSHASQPVPPQSYTGQPIPPQPYAWQPQNHYPAQPTAPQEVQLSNDRRANFECYSRCERNAVQLYFVQLGEETPDFNFIREVLATLSLEDVSIHYRSYSALEAQPSIPNEEHGLTQFLDQLFCQENKGGLFNGFSHQLTAYADLFKTLQLQFELYQTLKGEHVYQYLKIEQPLKAYCSYYKGYSWDVFEDGICSEAVGISEENFYSALQKEQALLEKMKTWLAGSFEFNQLTHFN